MFFLLVDDQIIPFLVSDQFDLDDVAIEQFEVIEVTIQDIFIGDMAKVFGSYCRIDDELDDAVILILVTAAYGMYICFLIDLYDRDDDGGIQSEIITGTDGTKIGAQGYTDKAVFIKQQSGSTSM